MAVNAVLLAVGISLASLLLCCIAIFLVCYFSLRSDCCDSKDEFGENEIIVDDAPLPRPDPETFEKMRLAEPSLRATKKFQPKGLSPTYFTKRYKGPIDIHQWQTVKTVHDLANDVAPPQLSRDKVTFSKAANEVYEFGSTIEKLKLDEPVRTKTTSRSDFDAGICNDKLETCKTLQVKSLKLSSIQKKHGIVAVNKTQESVPKGMNV